MPNVVKGSKQQKMVVVPHRPLRRGLFWLGLVVAIGVSAAGGFIYGYYKTVLSQEIALQDQQELQQELERMQQENADLSRQINILDNTRSVDQQANLEVQATLRRLREQVAQLEQDVNFYRQVVSENLEETGLTIDEWELRATSDPQRFRYRLVLRQLDADGDSWLEGVANINVIGNSGLEQATLPLNELSDDTDQADIKLRFRYYQNIEGEITLPEGFQPERVQVAAVSSNPVPKRINQDFDWPRPGE